MRSAGSERHGEGQAKARIPMVCDAMGDSAATTRFGWIPSPGTDRRSATNSSRSTVRHPGCCENAGGQTQTICWSEPKAERLMKPGRAVEMTGVWKARKTKPRFPSLPTALGNRCAISTFPQPRPTGPPHQKSNPRKEALRRIASLPASGSFFNELQ